MNAPNSFVFSNFLVDVDGGVVVYDPDKMRFSIQFLLKIMCLISNNRFLPSLLCFHQLRPTLELWYGRRKNTKQNEFKLYVFVSMPRKHVYDHVSRSQHILLLFEIGHVRFVFIFVFLCSRCSLFCLLTRHIDFLFNYLHFTRLTCKNLRIVYIFILFVFDFHLAIAFNVS